MGLTITDTLINVKTGLSSINSYGSFSEPPRWTKRLHTEQSTAHSTDEKTGEITSVTTVTKTVKYGLQGHLNCYAEGKTWKDDLQPVYILYINKDVTVDDLTGNIWTIAYTEAKAQLDVLDKAYVDDEDIE